MRRLLLLSILSAPLWAEMMDPINDLRLGPAIVMGPSIKESITTAAGAKASYDWKNTGDIALRYEAGYWQGMSREGRSRSGFIWSVGASYLAMDVTPQSYETGGVSTPNVRRDLALNLKEYGVVLGAGWSTQPSPGSLGDWNWEIMPVVRGGLLTIDTVTPGANPEIANGSAPFWEAGLTGGVVLSDKNWLIGLCAGWLYGTSEVKVDLPNGDKSELTVTRNGPEASLQVGIRF